MVLNEVNFAKIGRVNLIAGKNNSGKTALLDAIRIYLSSGHNTVINDVLNRRGLLKKGWIESYLNLFNRKIGENLFLDENSVIINEAKIKSDSQNGSNFYYRSSNKPPIELNPNVSFEFPKDNCIYLSFKNQNRILYDLWKEISLTPKEDSIIKILKETILPDLVRLDIGIDFVKFRLKKEKSPLDLGNFGDGVERVLLIALGLVNSNNSTLLIDEIEMGLHYSTIETLWKMIFEYSLKWDIQVFCTTHSQDAIKTFFYTANSNNEYRNDAIFYRLQHDRKNRLEAVQYGINDLEAALEMELEIR